MIIGLTGFIGAGKGVVCSYLKQKRFRIFSLSDVIREECGKRGLELTRENLINVGNELREEFGAGVLAKKLCEKFKTGENVVIDSVRHPAEVNVLKEKNSFHLIALKAPFEERLRRLIKRGREGDPRIAEQLRYWDEKEAERPEPNAQKIKACIDMADSVINNEGTFEELHKKIDELVNKINMR